MQTVALSLGADWPAIAVISEAGCADGRMLLHVDTGATTTTVRLARSEALALAAQILEIAGDAAFLQETAPVLEAA